MAAAARPEVSVITPVWNAAGTLAAAVASVRAQTEGSWELLLIDDGSTDGSGALAARLAAGEPRIRLLGGGARRGAAAARNRGIRAARGRRIAFLDADDRWYPGKLAAQLALMAATGCPLVFAAYRRVDADGRDLGVVPAPARVGYAELLGGNPIGCLTAVYDTAAFGKAEMPELPYCEDYGLWLRLLRGGAVARGLPEPLAEYRVAAGSASADKLAAAAAVWRLYRQAEGLPRARAARCFARYALRALRLRLPGLSRG